MKLTIEQVVKAVKGQLIKGVAGDDVSGVSTDSRKAACGDIFFPLIGETHDAHDFIPQAVANGCRTIITSRPLDLQEEGTINIIKVADTTKALQDLAVYYLSLFEMIKIGVTGSTGKTTTKDMLYWIFSEKYKTARNLGNLNNHIGLPLTILSIEEGTEAGIFEMGMSELGEIDLLARLVRPHIGIITNVGTSHIENLGTRENILKAKLEITNYFTEEDLLVVNEDNDFLSRANTSGNYRLITTGETGKSNFILSNIQNHGEEGVTFTLEHQLLAQAFKVPVPGRHNAYNAALAVAAAVSCGITMEEAAGGLEKMRITDKRLSIKGKNGMKIIDDTYNASPDSMKAAIDVLVSTRGFRKIAILADMFELGKESKTFHFEVGRYGAENPVDMMIAVGEAAKDIAAGALSKMDEKNVLHYDTKELLMKDLGSIISSGDVILVKGSRGMAMDEVVKKIMEIE